MVRGFDRAYRCCSPPAATTTRSAGPDGRKGRQSRSVDHSGLGYKFENGVRSLATDGIGPAGAKPLKRPTGYTPFQRGQDMVMGNIGPTTSNQLVQDGRGGRGNFRMAPPRPSRPLVRGLVIEF